MSRTIRGKICGVSLEAFTKQPTPEELGSIVALMDSEDQAAFFISLGEQLTFTCSYERYGIQLAYIRSAVAAQEEQFQTGYGSKLIADLQPDPKQDQSP